MLVVETIAKVRRADFVDGKSIKQIYRDLRLSRNTVRKVVRSGEAAFSYDRSVNLVQRSTHGVIGSTVCLRPTTAAPNVHV